MPPKPLRKKKIGYQKRHLKKQKTEQADKAEFRTMHKYVQVEPQVVAHIKNIAEENDNVDGIDNNNLNVDCANDDNVDVDGVDGTNVDDTSVHVGDVIVDSDDNDDTNRENMGVDDDCSGEIDDISI
ncbi:hypothetical protein Tco_1133267 [Tanacetum coccineum]